MTRLEVRVRAMNNANAGANRLEIELRKKFRPYIGKKVLLASRGLTKQVEPLIREAIELAQLSTSSVWNYQVNKDLGEFAWEVVVRDPTETQAVYQKARIWVGHVDDGGVLRSIDEKPENRRRTNYTAKEIEEGREQHRFHSDEAAKALDRIREFGMFDY